jgi:pimeloyl-ACP methyl ester carboxylesterase
MNRARHRGTAILGAVLLAVTAIAATGEPAKAVLTPGLVLTSTTATLPAELSSLATGKRIAYVTTSVTGSTIGATGLVLTPKTGRTYKTVVWGHGTTGLADQCTPSANQSVFWPEARSAIAALLAKGWTVTAPDYPGLGTAEKHPYLIGLSEARSMIDSVKAARRLDSALSTSYALDGHSQGGQGALFAGELAPSYDGSLVLRGVSAIAPVSNADIFAPMIPGTPGQGYLVMGLYGLQTVDSGFSANTYLAPTAKTKTSVLNTGCLYEILAAYADLTAEQLLVGGALPEPVVAKLVQYDNPGQNPTTAPVLLVQGTDDEAVPYGLTAGPLFEQLDAYSQPVELLTVDGGTHDSTVISSAGQVADWLAARFT